MIDAKSLRIGNIVIANGLYEREILTVEQIGTAGTFRDDKRVVLFKNRDVGEFVSDLEGVEITPEWLERMGFYRKDNSSVYRTTIAYEETNYPAELQQTGDGIQVCRSGIGAITAPVEYVHQLQNLYYALTGEELKIELP